MNQKRTDNLDPILARAVDETRAAEPEDHLVEAAAERVWARIAAARDGESGELGAAVAAATTPPDGAPLRECADYQALMPALVSGTLPEARRLLVEDHARECIPCRRALRTMRAGEGVEATRSAPTRRAAAPAWLRAASVAAAAVGAGALGWLLWGLVPVSQHNAVEIVTAAPGEVFVVGVAERHRLAAGDRVDGKQEIRTAAGSGAVVRLADGSTVEIAERSALEFHVRRRGHRILVERGSIIVEAAQQGSGSLGVITDEVMVSVTGTIFAVSHGTKGSRVSVIEGEVKVAVAGSGRGREEQVLLPGDQLGTRASPVSFEEELAWSRKVDQYLEMAKELAALRRDINVLVAAHPLRYSTRLLDLAPYSTTVYVALPNPTTTVVEAYRMLRERVSANPELDAWWQAQVEGPGFGPIVDTLVDHLRDLGETLGEEIAVTLSSMGEQGVEAPVVLAEVHDSMAFEAALEEKIAELAGMLEHDGESFGLRIVDDPFAVAAGDHEMLVWVAEDVMVATSSVARLQEVASVVQGAANPFLGTSFHSRLARSYSEGAELLAGVDLAELLPEVLGGDDEPSHSDEPSRAVLLELTGLGDAEHLLVERQQDEERAHTAATLSFTGPRRGMVSWLAEPGPMGALDFISQDASFVAAFVIEDPSSIVEELLDFAEQQEGDFAAHLAEIEAELGFSIEEVVAPLGGELAFALDGPTLPTPSWKLILEVYDEAGLQYFIEEAVARAAAASDSGSGLRLESSDEGSHVFYHLVAEIAADDLEAGEELAAMLDGAGAYYAYHDGYLVAAPSRALVERAIAQQRSDTSIVQAADFRALLPEDRYLDFSAVVFNRLGEAVQGLMQKVASTNLPLTEEQRQMLAELQAESGPSLHCAYGEEDRIRLVSNGPSVFPFLGVGEVFGLAGMFGMMENAPGGR